MQAPEASALLTRLGQLPPRMRALQQWLVWRFEPDPKRPKPLKVPYYVGGAIRHGKQGDEKDRRRLASFDKACQYMADHGCDGIGFAFLPGDGLIGIDIDGAIDADTGEVTQRCLDIIAACASYTERSPSGKGVHIIVQGEAESFKSNAIGLEVFCGRQYFTCTGNHWAGTPPDCEPIRPAVLARLKAVVDEAKAKPRAAAPAGQGPAPTGSLAGWLEQALAVLDSNCDYDRWIGVGMALRSALGDGGLRLWDYWSSKAGERYAGEAKLAAHWKSFKGDDADGALTVFKMARKAGWRPPKDWLQAYGKPRQAADNTRPAQHSAGADDGPPPEPPPPDGGDPPPGDPSDWRRALLRTEKGGKKDCRENVMLMLEHHTDLQGLVGLNEFALRVQKLRAPPWGGEAGEWTTADDYELGFWLATNEALVVSREGTLVAGVAMAAQRAKFHPVREYLRGLPAWDGEPRLKHWLADCLGAVAEDPTYLELVGAWFVMGMVMRILHPGCQMDYMIVLEGGQGKRKSTALRTLVGRKEWFADTPIKVGDKDALLSLAGIWLYEIGEMDAFNKAEVTAVKQYVSSREDWVREPFGRRFEKRARSGVFGGSTNQHEYFKDPTGARRMWPVSCDGEIRLDLLEQWRDQLFAEAMVRVHSKDAEERRYYPSLAETARWLKPEQEKREIGDPWFDKVATWLELDAHFGQSGARINTIKCFTTQELLTGALNVSVDKIDGSRQMATRVGIIMHRLGWVKKRDATGARLWRYWRPAAPAGTAPGGGGTGVEPPARPTPTAEVVDEAFCTGADEAPEITEF